MARIDNLQFAINNNGNGTANIDIRGHVALTPGEGNINCDCAVFGDDPVFDDFLFRFDRVTLGGDFGLSFRFNVDKSFAALDEDKRGKDEIYAEVVLSKTISAGSPAVEILVRQKTTTKDVPS